MDKTQKKEILYTECIFLVSHPQKCEIVVRGIKWYIIN